MADDKLQAPGGPPGQISGVEAAGGDPTAWTVAVVAVVTVVTLLAIIIALRAMFQQAQDAEYYAKVVALPQADLNDLWDKQQTALNSLRWLDPQHGVISLPIDRAMALTITELNRELGRGAAATVKETIADSAKIPETESQSKNIAQSAGQTH